MNNWRFWLEKFEAKPYSTLGLFILLAIPVTIMLVFHSQDNRSRASITCDITFTTSPSTTTDQSSAISSFLNSNAGKRICFTPGAIYRTDTRITLDGWTGTIFGQGATFKRYITPSGTGDLPIIRIIRSNNITIDGLNIKADATLSNIQNRVFGSGDHQGDHAFSIESSSNVTVKNASLTNLWGDGFYVRALNYSGYDNPDTNINVENVTTDIIGRNCISFISVDGMTIDNLKCSNASLHALDGEPNRTTDVVKNITVKNSDLRTFDAGHTPSGPGYAIALTPGYSDVQTQNVLIMNNTMDKGKLLIMGYSTTAKANNITVYANSAESSNTFTASHINNLAFSSNTNINLSQSDTNLVSPSVTQGPTPTNAPTYTNTPTPAPTSTPSNLSITSGPTVSNVSDTGATITWYLSDYGTGQIQYGTTTNYGYYSTKETSFNWTYHIQTLSNLTPATTYHYRVISTNKTGSTIYSSDRTFTTSGSLITPTPTLKPTSTPTPTLTQTSPTPTISEPTPTPTLPPGQAKKCIKIINWKFCF